MKYIKTKSPFFLKKIFRHSYPTGKIKTEITKNIRK